MKKAVQLKTAPPFLWVSTVKGAAVFTSLWYNNLTKLPPIQNDLGDFGERPFIYLYGVCTRKVAL